MWILIINSLYRLNKHCLSLMLTKKYDNASSQNEVIAMTISTFFKSSKKIRNQRWPQSPAVLFDANHNGGN